MKNFVSDREKYEHRESDYNKHVKISTERISKPIEQLGTNTNGKQMDKLAEMGGRLVEKRKSEEFEGVELPQFNSKQDPTGPGEGGKPFQFELKNMTADEQSKYNTGWRLNSFNQYASDIISIHRSLPDGRSDACKEQAQSYTANLQDISVIIIFHNEAFSVLLRSVHSILSRTPDHLLREIILVDDLSSHEDLKEPLDKYFNDFPKVQIVRATKRQGLTRARLLGYFVSTAPILVFLDSHIECFPMWAEPLCSRIEQDPTIVVFPSIEVVDPEHLSLEANQFVTQNGVFIFKDLTFNWQNIPEFENRKRKSPADPLRAGLVISYSFLFFFRAKDWAEPLLNRISEDIQAVPYPNIEIIRDDSLAVGTTIAGSRAIFVWKDLTFQWEFLPQYEKNRRKNDADPIRSPTMPGGLFAISRAFFEKLGTYDSGLDYWGGENIELSFKAWMCGGSVEMVTCSHIGHIFRKWNPIGWKGNVGSKNSVRVAEVWMDDYKNYYYERILFNLGNYGNVTHRKELRKRLNCKSFEWYIRNVYPNIVIPSNMKYAGVISSIAQPKCLDSMGGPQAKQSFPKMYPCHNQGMNQFWHFSDDGQIKQDEWFICFSQGQIASKSFCEPSGPTWQYREDQTMMHVPTGKCLTSSSANDDLTLAKCTDSKFQKWKLEPRRTDINFPS
ncbi:hypothetical protein RRG08_009099 [Elysia crispata]|uniref:Polypeptide N-acetylgalactosaminyltransferase n=1 Tax=Elysia crispata TaxID=231223 RepID=A0AAE0YYK3_9GAST|nr:hypothetical protein RRG08_009099 [Elysia crispata]